MNADKLLRVCLIPKPARDGGFVLVGLCSEAKLYKNHDLDLLRSLCESRKILWLSEEAVENSLDVPSRLSNLIDTFKKRLLRNEKVQTWMSLLPEAFQIKSPVFLKVPEQQEDITFACSLLPQLPHLSSLQIPQKKREKMLLHVCCGPDAAGVIDQLKEEFDLTCFWYDPNIQPKTEHDKRLEAFVKVCELKNTAYILGEYDVDRFLENIEGLEHTPEQGAKCSVCYDLRLSRAAEEAKKQGCDLYSSTLAISPHKVQEKLKNFGVLCEKKWGVPYYAKNFMKGNGFKESVAFTVSNNIYRQDYCGCWFSLHEGGPAARHLAQNLSLQEPQAYHFSKQNRPDQNLPLEEYWQDLEIHQNKHQNKYLSARRG